MDLGYAIIKGVIQGLTEFLPVSSTAHLVFMGALAKIFGWTMAASSPEEEEFFNILVQTGTLGAVVWFFRTELLQCWQLFRGQPIEGELNPVYEQTLHLKQLPKLLAISTVCTVVVTLGVLKGSELYFHNSEWERVYGIKDLSEFYFRYPPFVALHLIMTGVLLFVTETLSAKRESAPEVVGPKHAVLVGLFQAGSAIFHGLSRSGSTISGGLLGGLDRVTATRYSFLLSLPIFIIATLYESYKFFKTGQLGNFSWIPMIIGTVVAGVVGYYCVKAFVRFVALHKFTGFAIYCWVVGGFFFVYFLQQL